MPTILTQDQPLSPSNGPSTTLGNSNPSLSNSTPTIFDLDVPMALSSGVQTYTKHSISKYVSYHKLSKSHKAFTCKNFHIFISKIIQEALDNVHWKLVVLEEINALKK